MLGTVLVIYYKQIFVEGYRDSERFVKDGDSDDLQVKQTIRKQVLARLLPPFDFLPLFTWPLLIVYDSV